MSLPTISVGVALGVAEDGDFIIGDAARGVIGSTEFTVASGYTTVTPSAYSVSIRRGRWTRLWDSFEAASVSLNLWNHDRTFDPSHLLSPYSGYIVPGRGVRVMANDVDVFVGYIDDWDLEYDVSGQSTATLLATDAIGALSQVEFDEWTSSSTLAAGKLNDVCDRSEVDWSGALRDFDEGVAVLQSDSVSWGSNVGNYLALIGRSELGFVFSSAGGLLTFRDRNTPVGVLPVVQFGAQVPLTDEDGEYLTDEDGNILTGPGVPFQGISATIGSELLFSHVGVDREGGTKQTASVSDLSTWRRRYGPYRSLSVAGLLLADDSQSLAMAEYLLGLYDSPRYRISELTVDLTPLDEADQTAVLGLDITDTVEVSFTPNEVGDTIIQRLFVQGIQHTIGVERHVVTFSLIESPTPYFRIGDATYGVIGDDIIGF